MSYTRDSDILNKRIDFKTNHKVKKHDHEVKTGIEHTAELKDGIKYEVIDAVYHGHTNIEEIYIKSEPVNTSEFEDELETATVANTELNMKNGIGGDMHPDDLRESNIIIKTDIKTECEVNDDCEVKTGIEHTAEWENGTRDGATYSVYCDNSSTDVINTERIDMKFEPDDTMKCEEDEFESAAVTNTDCETTASGPDETCEARTINKFKQTKASSNQCDICKKMFVRASYLTKHKRIHSGEKPFKCDQCNKGFSQSSNLYSHKRMHSGDKSFKCEQCNKAFSRLEHLIRHKRIHSGEKPFKCEQCNKAFARSSCLIRHKRLHAGEKPFKCGQCDKAYWQITHLITHRQIHSGVKFKCDQCNKEFTLAQYLTRHKRKHKNGK